MYDLMLTPKPDLNINDKNKLCLSRKPSLMSWLLLSISVIIFFQIFRRLTDNILLTLVSTMGLILFGLDTLGEWQDFILDKIEKKATISHSTWSEKWIFQKTQKTTMKFNDICHVGASIGLGLFILCRNGQTFHLDTRGLDRQKIQNYRKEIHCFLNSSKISKFNTTQENSFDQIIVHSDSEDEKRFFKVDSVGNLGMKEKSTEKRFLHRRSSLSGFQCCNKNFLKRDRFTTSKFY